MERDSFRTRTGFIIACIGSAVGMGNIWLFPARVSALGGAAFLIPYFICVIVIGFTGVIGEMAFGRAMGAGPMGAFGKATEMRGKGKQLGEGLALIPVLTSFALAIGYSVVVGWILKYLVGSLTGDLFEASSVDEFGGMFNAVAGSFGNVGWHIVALVLTFVIMTYGIASGIEKANKIMMPLFFVMFVGMAIYISTLPGASAGYHYLTHPDWSYLLSGKTWVYALLMIPLSIGSYFSVEVLPMWVIGGLLTIGCVQISYQTIVQGFKAIIENLARRIGSGDKGAENV